MSYELKTKRGYDFYDCASAMQKAVRRADAKVAGYFALELFASGYGKYVWKRLYTISAEDVYGLITTEIDALHTGFEIINKEHKDKGRIFISKAIILLCLARKSRSADHLQNFVYDKNWGFDDNEVQEWIEDTQKERIEVPEYTYDVHTKTGRSRGKTKDEFFRDEQKALTPFMPSLFDEVVQ